MTSRLCHHPECLPHRLGLGCVPNLGHLFTGLRFSYKAFSLRGTWNLTTGPSLAFSQPSALFKMVIMRCSNKQKPLLTHAAPEEGEGVKVPRLSKRDQTKAHAAQLHVQNLPRKTSPQARGEGSQVSLGTGAEWDGGLTPGSGPWLCTQLPGCSGPYLVP